MIFQQPVLAEYRIPFFRSLAELDDIQDVSVIHGESPNIKNAPADGFFAKLAPEKFPLGGRLVWSSTQLKYATKKHCDVLIFSCNIRYATLIPGILRAKMNGVKVILWGHHASKRKSRFGNLIRDRVLFPLADSIVCYGLSAAKRIAAETPYKDKTFAALNSIDQAPVQMAAANWKDKSLQAFREAQGIGDGPLLLFVSRIKRRNQLEVLVEVVKRLKKNCPNIKAAIIGSGNDEQHRIKTLATQSGVGDSILFLGAIYNQSELAPWFLTADVFFYPAQIGLSILHAFGYGLPVIAGSHPQQRNPELESLEEGVNGFTFPEGDVDQAIKQVQQVINDVDLKRKISSAALRTVSEVYSMDRMVDGFNRAIEHATTARSRH